MIKNDTRFTMRTLLLLFSLCNLKHGEKQELVFQDVFTSNKHSADRLLPSVNERANLCTMKDVVGGGEDFCMTEARRIHTWSR
jgi:hypothetical protein